MAPALGSPVTQPLDTPTKHARRILPIVPAIPRILEKKPKSHVTSGKHETTANAVSPTREISEDGTVPATSTEEILKKWNLGPSEQTVDQEEKPLKAANGDDSCQTSGEFNGNLAEELILPIKNNGDEHSPKEEASHLRPPSHTGQSLNTETSPSHESFNIVGNTESQETKSHNDASTKSPQPQILTNHQPLRPTATTFHAHPTAPLQVSSSPTEPLYNGLDPTSPSTYPPHSAPLDDIRSSPTHINGHSFGHAHNISFYPPASVSSNDPSSPTRSVYQGYAYEANQYGYPPPPYGMSQHTSLFQPAVESNLPPGHQYTIQSPPYLNDVPFPNMSNQPPLTPSATPLDSVSQHFRIPNGYPPVSDRTQSHPEPPSSHLYQRSESDTTLKSDNLSSQLVDRTQDSPTAPELSNNSPWHILGSNDPQGRLSSQSSHGASLMNHVSLNFDREEYADCLVSLEHGRGRFSKRQWKLNSLIISQSPKLRELLRTAKTGENGRRVIEMVVNDRFTSHRSMEAALHVLYGMPVGLFPVAGLGYGKTKAETSAMRMSGILSFVASGSFLGFEEIVLEGLQKASNDLDWDNVELAVCFGLQRGLEMARTASADIASDPSSASQLIFTPSSSSKSPTDPSSNGSKPTLSPTTHRQHPPESTLDLLLYCFDFIISHLPNSWELDVSARPLADVDRLPVTAESRSPLCRSRLSRIQFGDHPSEATLKSRNVNVLVSTILISIPFVWLEYLLESAGALFESKIAAIVKERECRRDDVIQSRSVPWSERVTTKDICWAEAGYEESVKESEDGKLTVVRVYTGVTPGSKNNAVAGDCMVDD